MQDDTIAFCFGPDEKYTFLLTFKGGVPLAGRDGLAVSCEALRRVALVISNAVNSEPSIALRVRILGSARDRQAMACGPPTTH